jgi:hypothetical protein
MMPELHARNFRFALLACSVIFAVAANAQQDSSAWPDITRPQDYVLKRGNSTDPTGGNADYRPVSAGSTITLLDADGPGVIAHLWITIASGEAYHLKKNVLRMYWDGEQTPSVETPVGDFFGLGLGDYYLWQSQMLSVAHDKALNSFFPMPFKHHARVTLTNEGSEAIGSLYYSVEYRAYSHPLPTDTLYFHAQYRQAQPNHGEVRDWKDNGDPAANDRKNLDGKGNYTWLEASGRGHYIGVTMSILQNQDNWWGEGDDMFFIDGDKMPTLTGTGSEDYFLGAWDFGKQTFSNMLYGAPYNVGEEHPGGRTSVYRFHMEAPIPFTKSIRASIEHGHANHRSDNYFSVAYWYQAEPHAPFPALPAVQDRIPALQPVGGPGNNATAQP